MIPVLTEYRFSDLLMLKTIARLREEQVSPQRIRRSLLALKTRMKDSAFSDMRVYAQGNRVRVQICKQKMEPISGQLLFDFHESEINKLFHLPERPRNAEKAAELLRRKMEADNWFERGLELEQRGAPIEQVIEAYQKATALAKPADGAMVPMGTIFFNGHAWADAEEQYRRAIAVDPNYPLAHFNLANLYDERGDFENALFHYQESLRLFPHYADAHYNMALLYQNAGEYLSAVRHWKAYLKLDGGSSWGDIARRELGKLEAVTVVSGSRPRPLVQES